MAFTCTRRIWGENDDPAALRCTRTDPHENGHTYRAGSGSDLNADEPSHE